MRRCKLYDYDAHAWLDFNGQVTAVPVDSSNARARRARAEGVLPDRAEPDSPGVFFPPEQAAAAAEPALAARREDA